MHPSNNNSSNYVNYGSPISPASSLYHMPSPPMHYEDELLLQALIFQQQQSQALITPEVEKNNAETLVAASINNKTDDNGAQLFNTNNKNPYIDNKRAPKKDRHSKITTAHGTRDRRMRLSLDVAREFFDLQDTLGFDKASKTVEWLLTKSRSAIREVATRLGLKNYEQQSPGCGANSASSASECEAYYSAGISGDDAKAKLPSSANKEKNKKKAKPARIRAAFLPRTKESRKKARERARERTKMKKLDSMAHNDPNRFGNWSSFDGSEESGTSQQNKDGMFSQELPVMEELSSQLGTHVNRQLSGTYQQNNAGSFSQELEEPEMELFASLLHIHVNKHLSPFRD